MFFTVTVFKGCILVNNDLVKKPGKNKNFNSLFRLISLLEIQRKHPFIFFLRQIIV